MKPATLFDGPLEEIEGVNMDDSIIIPFPVYGTPKFDGIRCCIQNGKALTYNLKRIPNDHVRKLLEKYCSNGMDGELIVTHTTQDYFNNTQSGIMSKAGEPSFFFNVFDVMPQNKFESKSTYLRRSGVSAWECSEPFIKVIEPVEIRNMRELLSFERDCLKKGFEGIVLRTGDSPYKYGRSTLKQFWMVKYKRMQDAEAEVIGFKELMSNKNEKITNQYTGLTSRSSHKKNMIPMNMLGALECRDVKTNIKFDISGFTLKQRKQIWRKRKEWMGAIITYRYQPHGVKEKPRFPIFKGRRLD
jgi:DNA ligase-1